MNRVERQSDRGRHGLILVIVLVMIVLMSLLAAAYAFMVRAHVHTVQSNKLAMQAKFAADAGFQRAVVMLRTSRGDINSWYDDPDAFHGYPVEGGDEEANTLKDNSSARTYDPNARETWRFSLVHPDYDDRSTVKYGVVDEGARLNINTATEAELRSMFTRVIPEDPEYPVDIDVLVDSLLDWRSAGGGARPNGAKDAYYMGLTPAYKCKQALFSTVEELLLVRGFSGWVLFGEDYNRNGMLDPNEDDGDTSFPPDNGDGTLYAGIAPFLTIWSREYNQSADGRPRINLNMRDTQKLQELMEEDFDTSIVSYVMDVRSSGKAFNSVMNLIPAPPPPEEEQQPEEQGPTSEQSESSAQPEGDMTASQPTEQTDGGKPEGNKDKKTDPNGPPGESEKPSDFQSGEEELQRLAQEAQQESKSPSDSATAPQGSTGQAGSTSRPTRPVYADLTPVPPPGTYDDLPKILDRLTVAPTPGMQGRINISTAPREVLAAIDALTDEQLDAIVNARKDLESSEKMTPAWLLTRNVIDEYTFRGILDRLTTGAATFRVEAIGYADHVGVVRRVCTVFEMRGPIAQVLYQRDLTPLGPAYNPYGEEKRGVAAQAGK